MDKIDAEKYVVVYQMLADILERDRADEEHPLSFLLGDLARRVFVGTQFEPPDELLEESALAIRHGDHAQRQHVVKRLREHAQHLQQWDD